jgi:hypothetical protein
MAINLRLNALLAEITKISGKTRLFEGERSAEEKCEINDRAAKAEDLCAARWKSNTLSEAIQSHFLNLQSLIYR